jgi:cobaltochelatase CobS
MVASPPMAATVNPADPMAAFAAFQQIMASMQPSLDPDQIRGIVADAIADEVDRIKSTLPVVTIEVRKGQEVKTVAGITHDVMPDVLATVASGEHVMLVGPAGTGKTHLAKQVADALSADFWAVQVGPTMTEARLLGYMNATGAYVGTVFRDWCEKGGVLLMDEVDNGNASVLNVLNSALGNGFVAFPDGMVQLNAECVCIAAGNTFGNGPDRKFVGRQALDFAFLNRFTWVIVPVDERVEESICLGTGADKAIVASVLRAVRSLRKNAENLSMATDFTPRQSRRLCRLLAAGIKPDRAIDMALRGGLSDPDWNRVTGGNPVTVHS